MMLTAKIEAWLAGHCLNFASSNNPIPNSLRKWYSCSKIAIGRYVPCIALGAIVRSPNELVIEGLVRVLKDGSINKNTVCETMIHMGSAGEEILV
jgi:hypothetical protein